MQSRRSLHIIMIHLLLKVKEIIPLYQQRSMQQPTLRGRVRIDSVGEIICNFLNVQAVSCQWTVDLRLHQFDNKYNAEMDEEGRLCCCDRITLCRSGLANLLKDCPDLCETSFNVSVAPCTPTEEMPCFVETTQVESIAPGTSFAEYGYFFHLSSNAKPENVSQFVYNHL